MKSEANRAAAEKTERTIRYMASAYLAGLSLYCLYRIYVDRQNTFEHQYGLYAGIMTFILQLSLKQLSDARIKTTPRHDNHRFNTIRDWYPLIGFSILGILLLWPLAFCPTPFEPWRFGAIFALLFGTGAFIQFLVFAKNMPAPSQNEKINLLTAYPVFRKLILERSLHSGVSLLDCPAPRTGVVAEQLTFLPFQKIFVFKTQFDDQQQIMLDFFWDVHGQKIQCERFVVSNIPKGPAGEKDFRIEIFINLSREIDCNVDKPLTVTRKST